MNRREFLIASAGMIATAVRPAQAAPVTQPADAFLTDFPDYPGNVLLARPTDRTITFSILAATETTARVLYRRSGSDAWQQGEPVRLQANEPKEHALDSLIPDASYDYRLVEAASGKLLFPDRSSGSFHTARKPGSSFVFTIQADSHLDDGCRTDIYQQTLANQLADKPDFMIDMGDTSMAGKHPSRESAVREFAAQRYYFGQVGHAVPTFLVVGNHDGEEAKLRGATAADGLAVWANRQRKRYFANPIPDRFYSGNDQPHEHAGLLQNYYAWTWGDALLVVLDPYWTSTAHRGHSGGWNMSLGRRQYDWLAATLRASKARYKLVFIHQLVGGLDDAGRGGAEAAACFEWGGQELDGRDTFVRNRPGWPVPIHQLLRDTGVSAVFHGHDHFFADQEKDGIRYVLAPQAAHRNFRATHAEEYRYRNGRFLPNSGHLRVSVGPAGTTIQYIRSVPPGLQRRDITNGSIADKVKLAL